MTRPKRDRTGTWASRCPPWIVFCYEVDGEKIGDVLPAGRPGAVLEGLPLALAKRIAEAANRWYSKMNPPLRPGEVDAVLREARAILQKYETR